MKLKIQGSIILFSALFLISCSDSSTGNSDDALSLSGYLENWQTGTFQDQVYFGVAVNSWFLPLDSTLFSSDGSFQFHFPFPSPPDSALGLYQAVQISNSTVEIIDSVTFSGVDPRYALGSIYACMKRGGITSSITRVNNLVLSDSSIGAGDFYCQYFYSLLPTKISGWRRTTIKLPVTSTYKYRVFLSRIDVQTVSGWNSITTQIESIHDSTIEYRASSVVPASYKWFQTFGVPYSFSNSVRW